MRMPSLNDLALDGTLNTTNQPTNQTIHKPQISLNLLSLPQKPV